MAIWLSHKLRGTSEFFGTLYHPGKHIIPLIILVVYSFLGGWLFVYLENPDYFYSAARKSTSSNKMTSAMNEINFTQPMDQIDYKLLYTKLYGSLQEALNKKNRTVQNYTEEKRRENVTSKLYVINIGTNKNASSENWRYYEENTVSDVLQEELVILLNSFRDEIVEFQTNSGQSGKTNYWDIWNATLYAASLYTTIGYGNIVCHTVGGRVATMLYSMIGIPLVLTILNDLGELLFKCLKILNVKGRKVVRRFSTTTTFPQTFSDISVMSALLLLLFWICACAGIFLFWETNWDYFTSFYFFFITLTTIGLGDITPDRPELTLAAFVLVLLGLSVVSMCISIIQNKIDHVFQGLLTNIDSEYQQKVLDPSRGNMEEEECAGEIGVEKLYKEKTLTEKLLYKLMDKHKKQMLISYWKKKASTKNEFVQTVQKTFHSVQMQVDLDDEEEKRKRNRKYIYNLND